MKQSKKQSLIEVVTSTLIGMLVSIITQMIVFPIYGMEVNLFQNFQITVIFTVVSIIRSYFVRRVFNK
jgi:hypothetical protein